MSGTLPTVIQEDCKETTKYVWFYQPHVRDSIYKAPMLEICEVQIFDKLTSCITLVVPIVLNIKYCMFLCYVFLNPSNRLHVQTYMLGCETGTYDVNCSKTCSHCNNKENCGIDTGECDDNGCALPGFKSHMCNGK